MAAQLSCPAVTPPGEPLNPPEGPTASWTPRPETETFFFQKQLTIPPPPLPPPLRGNELRQQRKPGLMRTEPHRGAPGCGRGWASEECGAVTGSAAPGAVLPETPAGGASGPALPLQPGPRLLDEESRDRDVPLRPSS